MLSMTEKLFCICILYYTAEIHDRHAIRNMLYNIERMGYEQICKVVIL